MWDSRVRHHRSKQNVYLAPRDWSTGIIPSIKIHLLATKLLAIELPILIDRNRISTFYKSFDVGENGFVAGGNLTPNILASVSRVILILEEVITMNLISCL